MCIVVGGGDRKVKEKGLGLMFFGVRKWGKELVF